MGRPRLNGEKEAHVFGSRSRVTWQKKGTNSKKEAFVAILSIYQLKRFKVVAIKNLGRSS